MAKEIYWERKFSKNKDGDSSFLPELQRRQNDNMAIPEIQYAVLWTLQRHTVVFGKPVNRYNTPPKLIFRVKSGFYACMGRVETPVVEFFGAHTPSEAHRISASFKQPGPVTEAAGQQTHLLRQQKRCYALRATDGRTYSVFTC